MTRPSIRKLGRALIALLLFAQMAIAAYACPGLSGATNAQVSSVSSAGLDPSDTSVDASPAMPNCDGMSGTMDPNSVNLCAEHCRYGQQSDQSPTVTVPVVLLTTLYIAPAPPELSVPTYSRAAATSALAAATPPHAILHCCFRI